jgi:hypothetical protein
MSRLIYLYICNISEILEILYVAKKITLRENDIAVL